MKTFLIVAFFFFSPFKSHKKIRKGPKLIISFIWNRWPISPLSRSPFSCQVHSIPTLSPTLLWGVFKQDITLCSPCAWSWLNLLMNFYFYGSFCLIYIKNIIPFEWYLWFWEWNSEESSHDSAAPHLSLREVWGTGTDSPVQGKRVYFKTCCNSSVALAEHPSL